ncbi:hypothetical protein CMALT394_20115 [Carnobacterium maltaromaticum]|nr:hypothetical protein CMALT394_20115 [Carnobacterium maltaromaticum]
MCIGVHLLGVFLYLFFHLLRLVLMSQSFEKKIKIRDGKKRHINFSYFLARPKRLNELFIKASSYEPSPRKKDEIPSK